MPNRKPHVGGNWKMNLHHKSATALTGELVAKLDGTAGDAVDVTIFPAFPYLASVSTTLCDAGSKIRLGAQDCYSKDDGPYTGEVSIGMLQDVGVNVVLVGHSERRHVIGESDHVINQKVAKVLDAGLEVILCIGETLEQRETGQTDAVNLGQLALGLAGVTPAHLGKVTVAYEPVWAIGTGKTATPQDAQAAHRMIRAGLTHLFGRVEADAVRIQYGGSMKPGNAADLLAQPDIDGGLIGGASLKADDFAAIVDAAK